MMRLPAIATLLMAPLVLAGCATSPTAEAANPIEQPAAPLAYAKIGQTVYADGPSVTPVELLEDSRCPANVTCVWAGQVRVKARIHLGSGDEIRELTMGKPIQVADGTLNLIQVLPDKRASSAEVPEAEYRFGFRFMGGL